MSDRIKILFRLALFLCVAVLIGIALYFAFLRKAPSVTTTPEEQETASNLTGSGDATGGTGETPTSADGTTGTGALPISQIAEGGAATATLLLTNTEIVSPTMTRDGTLAYYDPADGHFYTINSHGDVTLLSQARFPNAENVTIANNATAAVIEFPDGSNVVYDFISAKQTTLPSHWEDFSFSEDGSEIATKSIGNDASNRSLVITATDGSHTDVIAALGENDDKVDVNLSPSGNVVAFSATGYTQSFDQNQLYLIGQTGDAVGSVTVVGANFSAIWSPDGTNILYSVSDASNNYRPSLWYTDSRGDRHGGIRLHLGPETWVEKCTFASASTIYCAVPRIVADGSGDNHSLVTSPDTLYQIDLPSGKATPLGYAAAETAMFNLTVSENGNTLYFQDASGRLLSMKLH